MGGDAVDCTLFNDYSESLVTLSCGSISIQYGDGSTSTSFYRSTACGISEEDAAIISLSEQYVEDPFQAQDGYPEDPEAAIPHATASTPYGDSVVQTAIGSGEGTTLDPVYFGTITATPPNQTRIETLRLFGKIDQDIGYGLITRQVSFIAVVPFYDSEAVYLKGTKTTNTANVYDRSIGESMSGWQGGRWYPLDTPGGGLFSAYAKFGSPDGIATGGTQYGLTENISNTSEYSAMICNSGTYLNPAFPSERSFSSTTDIVMQKYPTYESASGESVYAPDNGINDGLGGVSLADKPFSFVGWA